MNPIVEERERIRAMLRGQHLPKPAIELDVPIPVLEAFVTDRANLAPGLMADLSRILARQQNVAAPPIKSTPAPTVRSGMKLTAKALKITAMLNARDPGSSARVMLEIAVGGRVFTADVAAKSVRKCKAVIAEHGPDKVALILQGKLDGNAIGEAGLTAQVKVPRPTTETGVKID